MLIPRRCRSIAFAFMPERRGIRSMVWLDRLQAETSVQFADKPPKAFWAF